MGSCELAVAETTSLSPFLSTTMSAFRTKMLCVVLMHNVFFVGLTSSMFSDDYDPNDIPLDQAKGYSYPVPSNPLSLPLPVVEDEYDATDIPEDQAAPAPTGYLPAVPQFSPRKGR